MNKNIELSRPIVAGRALARCLFVVCIVAAPSTGTAQNNTRVSGELRTRAELRENADFNTERQDAALVAFSRFRLGIERQIGRRVRVMAQFQDARLWGEEGSTLAALDNIDLHQAYVDIQKIAGLPLSVRVGRQELRFGKQRLVGAYDWHQNGRAFDAINFCLGRGKTRLNVWASQIRELNAPGVARNQEFLGAYFSRQSKRLRAVDLYLLFFFDERNYAMLTDAINPPLPEDGTSHLASWTAGGRTRVEPARGVTLDLEGAYQFGTRGPQDIRAFGFAAEGAISVLRKSRLVLEGGFLYGSGDDTPGDLRTETFSNLFPDAHSMLGAMDYVGWSNTKSPYFGCSGRPFQQVRLRARVHLFRLATDRDNWYGAGGYLVGEPAELLRRGVPGAGSRLGEEWDFSMAYSYRGQVTLSAGFSFFRVGQFVRNSGGVQADNSIFGYLSLKTRF